MTLEERVARLEQQQNLATKADLLEIRRDIADLAAGIGTDLRAVRQDIAGIHQDIGDMRRDIRGIHNDLTEIRGLLERRTRWWPF